MVTVRTEDPEPVTDSGEKEVLVPAGKPLTLNTTIYIISENLKWLQYSAWYIEAWQASRSTGRQ